MKALISLFLALSIILGPLQEINAAAEPRAEAAANGLTVADVQLINSRRSTLEQVFLVSLLNRTRLFEILNKVLFQAQNDCLQNPFSFYVTVKQSGNCPAIVNEMLYNIKVNYPDIRKLYAVYNLIRNSKILLDALTQREGYRFSDGPIRTPLGEAQTALDYSRDLTQGPIDVSLSDLSLKSPIPTHFQGLLNGFDIQNIRPTLEDYQLAASNMAPMLIAEPCDSCKGGLEPTNYDLSVTGLYQKECSDYVAANLGKMLIAPDYARWPRQSGMICKDFRLAFNRNTQKFSFVLSGLPRDSSAWNHQWLNLYRDVVNKGLMAHRDDMVAYVKIRLFDLISQAPYAALVGTPTPSLFALKNAIRSIAHQAAKDESDFEKLFLKLRVAPNSQKDYQAKRKQYLALMDRSQVVKNLLQYPSPDMQAEADNAVFGKIAQDLTFERQMNQTVHNVVVSVAWLALPVVSGYLCTALAKIPATICSSVIMAATVGLSAPYVWQSFSNFNQIFGEMFAGQQIGNNEADGLAASPKLARIDSSVANPAVLRNLVLRDLDEVDSAYDAEIFQIVSAGAGAAIGVKFEVPRVNALYKVLSEGLESKAAIESPEAAKDAAKIMKAARFLARLNPFGTPKGTPAP